MIVTVAEQQSAAAAGVEGRWRDPARLLRVVAHPARLAILELLCVCPRCVKEINALVPLAQSCLSQHMAALRKADLVASHACGTRRCYYVLQPALVRRLIRLLAEPHPVQHRDCESIMQEARQFHGR